MREDPELFDYRYYADRPDIVWPGGAKVAVWVVPNTEFYELNPAINPLRPACRPVVCE